MTQEHPITPPPELVQQWRNDAPTARDAGATREAWIATQAARWGSDQELEACCAWFRQEGWNECHPNDLRSARRPKPPSLKERALAELDLLKGDANAHGLGFDATAIRRALESLPD